MDSELCLENVRLRQLMIDDITERYMEWLNDSETNQFLEVRKNIPSLGEQREYVNSCLNSADTFMLGIFNEKNELIGSVTLKALPSNILQVGLMIGEKNHLRKGIGKKVIKIVRNWAIERRFFALTAGYDIRNEASAQLFRSSGFKVLNKQSPINSGDELDFVMTTILSLENEGGYQ